MAVTGVGILFLENYWTPKYGHKLACIVTHDMYAKKWQDFGGAVNYGETSKEAAVRETMEESYGYLNISKDVLTHYVDIKWTENNIDKIYRIYIILLPNKKFFGSNYYSNKNKLLNSLKTPKEYKETTDITRIFLDDLPTSLLQQYGPIYCKDSKQKNILLDGRTKVAIRLFKHKNMLQNMNQVTVYEYNRKLFCQHISSICIKN